MARTMTRRQQQSLSFLSTYLWLRRRRAAVQEPQEEESPLLLHDTFDGSAGPLSGHNPTPVWTWDGWQYASTAAAAGWALNGSGGVSQTTYPTAGQNIQSFFAFSQVATTDPHLTGSLMSPASGGWRNGFVFRYVNSNNYTGLRVNSTNNLAELYTVVAGNLVVQDSAAMTASFSTLFAFEVDCVGTDIVATVNGVELTYSNASMPNTTAMMCGLYEGVALNGGHSEFLEIQVEPSASAGPLSGRIAYMPASASILTEWDSQADSGDAVSDRDTGSNTWSMQIDTSVQTSGARLQFQCDEDGQRPAAKGAAYTKNLPDKAWFTSYVYIPANIERTGNFWLLLQWKQRATDTQTAPTISMNLGWNGSAMVTELNNNIDTDGSWNGAMPDLSQVNYVVTAGEWHRFDFYYHWHPTNGRVRLWMDGTELYDFEGIRTMVSSPPEDWVAPQYPRLATIAHYSDGLSPASSTIYFDEVSFDMFRSPDEYPVAAPV